MTIDLTSGAASAVGLRGDVAAAPPLLDVAGLTIRTDGGATLVDDVSFTVLAGQAAGIVGESGSGKSLTARAVTGLLARGLTVSGAVSVDGVPALGARESQWRRLRGRRVSLLMQDPFTMLNPLQTAARHIIESLPRGRGRQPRGGLRAEVERRLGEVGLAPDVADRHPFQLSGGMRQRLALAAALAGDPDLLIADEPTTALDVTTQSEILRLLARLQEERRMALVLITHDLGVAFSVCERIHVMYAGSLVEQGPARDLAGTGGHPYTVGLRLAEPPFGHYAAELGAIPGRVPAADAVAGQCAFADRCGWATEVCRESRPALTPLGRGRESACVRIEEIRADLQRRMGTVTLAGAPTATAHDAPVLLQVENVRRTFRITPMLGRARDVPALEGVSFEVKEGEVVGLIGETGSGKSTIARLLLGLDTPDEGRIALGGLDLTAWSALTRGERQRARRRVQMVFQDPYSSLNPARSVGSILREVVRASGVDASDSDEHDDAPGRLLTQVGLPPEYAGRRPAQLSGGERQRVAIARALAVGPDLLVCDEPVAALDVSAQAQVLQLLRDLRERHGMAMLFITHDLAVVRQVAQRLVVLRHGEVVEVGRTEQVLEDPQHEYTTSLVAAAKVTRADDEGPVPTTLPPS